MKIRFTFLSIIVATSIGFSLVGVGRAHAATYLVNSTADTDDSVCDNSNCTLREAINAANANSGADTVAFSVTGTILLESVLPNLADNVTISGPGANILTVMRDPAASTFRIFTINSGKIVTIAGLTVTNGSASGIPPGNYGGGIYNDHGTLTLSNCTLSGNSASNGGGITNDAEPSGSATLKMENCTLTNNSASGTPSGTGGAIFNNGQGAGNAILDILNSTLSGNSAAANSGAILNDGDFGGSATLKIVNSTFSNNSAGNSGSISNTGAVGGTATVEMGNSILNTTSLANDIGGTITSDGYNLSSDNGGGFLTATGDQTNTDPKLGSLADNGGPTKTHALLLGSPAIDKGKNFTGSSTDQRGTGFDRTFDDPAIMNATDGDGTDIGAYEFKDTDGDGVEDFRDNCPSTPNPEKIAFVSYRNGNAQIYVMNADGTNPIRLTNNATNDYAPSFSPDGSKILFTSQRDGNNEIYVMNADGTNQTNLSNNAAWDWEPAFSRDGSKIVFSSNRDHSRFQIFVMNADGSNPTNLSNNDEGSEAEPAFSPDGSKIIFRSSRDGNAEIYVMDADGMNQTNLSNNAANDDHPAFSPDGSKIVFRSKRDGNFEIYMMDADGSNQTNLSNNAAVDEEPFFSPDGSKIVFDTNRDSITNYEVYVMNADGSNPMRLSNNAAADSEPTWGTQADSDDDGIGDACENTPPTAGGDSYSTNEDTPLSAAAPGVLGNDSDPDAGDSITAVLVSGPSHAASFTLNADGSFNYTPASNYNGGDSFTYKARDSHGVDSNIATVNITVNAVNDSPSFTSTATLSRKQGAGATNSQIATVSDVDNSAGSLTVTVQSAPTGISVSSIQNTNGTITANVAAACNATQGSNTVVLKVSDGNKTANGNLTVNVTPSDPATITLKPSPKLSPANHKYHTIKVSDLVASATDDCGGNVINSVFIVSASSDEPEDTNGTGDGATKKDIVIANGCGSVQLRAERAEAGNGRVYRVNLRLIDSSGNVTNKTAKVLVPRSGPAVDNGPAGGYTVIGPCGP